jgi:hypothetical protein
MDSVRLLSTAVLALCTIAAFLLFYCVRPSSAPVDRRQEKRLARLKWCRVLSFGLALSLQVGQAIRRGLNHRFLLGFYDACCVAVAVLWLLTLVRGHLRGCSVSC